MKRKILACVLACLVLFLGFGYAAWTDSLQINGTADTGELKVKFTDLAMFGQYGKWNEEPGWSVYTGIPGNVETADYFFDRHTDYNEIADEDALIAFKSGLKKYTTTDFELDYDTTGETLGVQVGAYPGTSEASSGINVDIHKIYPGYAQLFRTDIVNVGTLAAQLADVNVTTSANTNSNIHEMIGISLSVVDELGNDIQVLEGTGDDVFTVGGETFVRLSAITANSVNLKDLPNNSPSGPDPGYLYLAPAGNATNNDENYRYRMDAFFGVAMDPDWRGTYTTGHIGSNGPVSTVDDSLSENRSASFTVDFYWDQMNIDAITPAALQ